MFALPCHLVTADSGQPIVPRALLGPLSACFRVHRSLDDSGGKFGQKDFLKRPESSSLATVGS